MARIFAPGFRILEGDAKKRWGRKRLKIDDQKSILINKKAWQIGLSD